MKREKWHYETRISTELDVTFHMKPDHYGIATENALKRKILPVSFAAMKNTDNTERTWIRVTCVLYEAK